jgi:general secretion pathway protein E
VLDAALQGAIHPHSDGAALRKRAAQQGLQPLRLAGAMKVAQGQTTLDEVLRATPRWE